MLIQAQMVPLPVTAGEKFREAVYFFESMNEIPTNVRLFPFHFSAFLSALRSVTFYLRAAGNCAGRLRCLPVRRHEETSAEFCLIAVVDCP